MLQTEQIEQYILQHIDKESDYLNTLYRQTHIHLLNPRMATGHIEGRTLTMLTHMIQPKSAVEIGTYSGYSALCIAEAIPADAILYTIDINDELQPFTTPYIQNSGLAHKIKYIIGDARNIIPTLDTTFDMAYIDGDKRQYNDYFDTLLPRINNGGYILVDNTLWDGHVLTQPHPADKQTAAIKAFNNRIATDNTIEKIILPLRDGLTIIRKK